MAKKERVIAPVVFNPPKHTWGEGPWNDEIDYLEFTDPTTGVDCLVRRNQFGALCDYVRIPQGHPASLGSAHEAYGVHGGVTFAGTFDENSGPEGYWLGFDCAHSFDYSPGLDNFMAQAKFRTDMDNLANYKTVDYVKAECHRLALQLLLRSPEE